MTLAFLTLHKVKVKDNQYALPSVVKLSIA